MTLDEAKFTTLEEKGPDALEMATQTNEKGKAQASCQVVLAMNTITQERLKKYFQLTSEALSEAEASLESPSLAGARADFLDMIERYLSDASHFAKKGDVVTAFAALNYAHGWLDAGARIGLFKVHTSRLFTVDDEKIVK